MDKLHMWCKGFSVVTIISGVMLSLIPDNKLLSSFKTLIAVVLTVMFISPLSGLIGNDINNTSFTFDTVNQNELIAVSNNLLYNCAKDVIKEKIEEKFSTENINAECDVLIAKKNNNIIIEKVIISGKSAESDKIYIKQIIYELLKSQVNIEFSG